MKKKGDKIWHMSSKWNFLCWTNFGPWKKPGRGRDSPGTLYSYFNLMNTYSDSGFLTYTDHTTLVLMEDLLQTDMKQLILEIFNYNFPIFKKFTVPGYPKTRDL